MAAATVPGVSTKAALASMILLAPGLLPAADKPVWIQAGGAAETWEKSLSIRNDKRAVLVLDSPTLTRLRGIAMPHPPEKADSPAEERAAKLLEMLKPDTEAGLTLEWLGADPVKDFIRAGSPDGGQARSVHRVGSTTVTRTVLASREDDTIFIHLLADQPGALSFRVSIPGNPAVRLEDRRQLVVIPEKGPLAHVWVIPFESDVEPDGRTIVLRGEGEALIVWKFSPDRTAAEELAGTWKRLAERHDPGHTPPDVSKVWHGILDTHLKSAKNSP